MKTGIQVSSFRPILKTEEEVFAAFEKMAAMGCRFVQLQWIDPAVPVEFIAAALKKTGIASVSVQDFYTVIRDNPEYYIKLNRATGGTWMCVSRIPAENRSREGLDAFVAKHRAFQEKLAPLGQKRCLHPVSADFAPIDGLDPVGYVLENMPELDICADLYHLNKVCKDMPGWLRKYGRRVVMVHFKEGRGDTLVPAGQGDMDWTGVVPACLEIGTEYAFVEQERWEKDPFVCIKEALIWLRGQM